MIIMLNREKKIAGFTCLSVLLFSGLIFGLIVIMGDFEKFVEQGKQLGLTGESLMKYVERREEQNAEREERSKKREHEERIEREKRENEREQRENEREQRAHEERMKAQEAGEKEKQRQHEMAIAQMRSEAKRDVGDHQGTSNNSQRGYIPKLPPFQEDKDEIDSFLYRFEAHATTCEWEKEKWPLYVASLLKGSALTLYHSMASKGSTSWEDLKRELLKKFQCTEEGFREKFRQIRPEADESFAAFLIRAGHLLDRWVELSNTPTSYGGLRDLILREQILQSVSPELGTFLRERDIPSAEVMCKLAEQYREARPGKSCARKNTGNIFEANVSSLSTGQYAGDHLRGLQYRNQGLTRGSVQQNRGNFGQRDQPYLSRSIQRGGQSFRRPFQQKGYSEGVFQRKCWNCGGENHLKRYCLAPRRANVCETCGIDVQEMNPTDEEQMSGEHEQAMVSAPFTGKVEEISACSDIHPGLEVEKCSVNGFSASLLRDTGCTTAGVRKSLVKEEQYTGQVQRCRSFGGNIESFPLANIEVITPYYEGKVLACVIDRPVTDLILGNLPGIRTARGGKSGSIIHEQAVVSTRAQTKAGTKPTKPVKIPQIEGLNVSSLELIELQRADASLGKTFEQVRSKEGNLAPQQHCFVLRDQILTRVYQEGKEKIYQIEVPKKLRKIVLQVAHDLPMSGHFGVRRTLSRVLTHFHWPTVRKDVAAYCLSCDTCQKTVPKGRIPSAPLQPMPLISEPFQRIAIDLIGPMHPVSSSGHTHVLTIVDAATRYPEAIPLKKIDSVTVAEALVSVFARMGCPKEILSDCGTQMISDLMKEVHRLLGVTTVTTTPYHPQSNGMVERFNGTIKAMIKKVVQDQPKDWDRMIPAVLFAYRELPNASTGFSPFELMFGRPARGPIYLLAQSWSGKSISEDQKNVFQYVFDLKNRLDTACELAKNHVAESAEKYKVYADRKAKVRTFRVGEKVLVLLSNEKSKLLTQWKGPYEVLEKTSAVDYRINMEGQKKIFHVNMLKGYVERKDDHATFVQDKKRKQEQRILQETDEILVNASVSVGLRESENVEWSTIVDNDFCQQVQKMDAREEDTNTEVTNPCMLSVSQIEATCVGMVKEAEGDIASVPTIPTVRGESVSDVHIANDLDSDTVQDIEELLNEFSDILTDKPGKAVGVAPHRIILTDNTPVRKKPYPLPFSTRQTIEKEVQYMLELGVIEPSCSAYSSPVVLVSKKDGSVRFCIDYRALNEKTVFDSEPIPEIDELLCSLTGAAYFAKLDLTKGYWQIPIAEQDKDKTTFQTPLGLFQWTRMPFGLQNAPATFARAMRQLQLQKHSAISFFDDILVYAENIGQLMVSLRGVLTKLRDFGLCVRPSKLFVAFKQLDFLGHRLAQGQIRPQEEKVQKIVDASVPQTKKQVRALLGLMGYYRQYVPNFASKVKALTDLTKGTSPRMVKWTDECKKAVEEIQKVLLSKPVLALPDLSKEFILRTDASATGMGGVLFQETDETDGLLHPVRYISKKFSDTQMRYSTIERECLAIVFALMKLSRFLLGRDFTLQTDHRPLTFLKASKTKNNRLLRWALIIQEYKFTVKPISGRLNVLADMLSRI